MIIKNNDSNIHNVNVISINVIDRILIKHEMNSKSGHLVLVLDEEQLHKQDIQRKIMMLDDINGNGNDNNGDGNNGNRNNRDNNNGLRLF